VVAAVSATSGAACDVHVDERLPCPTCAAYDVVERVWTEVTETHDGPPEERAYLDYSLEGEAILRRHIAEALRAARAR
jgi:hypothetical protein